jgi:hypothetical protein
MTREKYLILRKNNEVSLEMLYQYFIDISGNTLDFSQFSVMFNQFQRNFNLNLDNFFQYYDAKFEIILLHDNKGRLLKIY